MTKPQLNLRTNRLLQGLIVWYLSFWVLMAVAPRDRSDWLLENLLVFIVAGFLLATYRAFPLSNLSYLLITIFLTLHAVGAHYTYEHAAPGYWLKDLLGLKRNHFDRLVHFAFGLLLTYPLWESLQRVVKASRFWLYFLPFAIVLAASSFFEKLEFIVAQIVSPELGTAYLGTQGDVWDAQKDMMAAMLGALLCLLFMLVARKAAEPQSETATQTTDHIFTRRMA